MYRKPEEEDDETLAIEKVKFFFRERDRRREIEDFRGCGNCGRQRSPEISELELRKGIEFRCHILLL